MKNEVISEKKMVMRDVLPVTMQALEMSERHKSSILSHYSYSFVVTRKYLILEPHTITVETYHPLKTNLEAHILLQSSKTTLPGEVRKPKL